MADWAARCARWTFVRSHPVSAVLAWFFTVGQAIAFVPVVMGARGVDLPVTPFVVGSTLIGLLLPVVVVTLILDGRGGMGALCRSAARTRVGMSWYALAFGVVPLATVAMAAVLFGAPVGFDGSDLLSAVLLGLILQTVVGLAAVNLAEEVAWTGFLQARIQARCGPLLACAVVGPLFALQHLPLVAANGGHFLGSAMLLLVLMVLAIPFRAAIGWSYNRSGSLFVAGLIHAAGNATAVGGGIGEGLLPRLYPGETVGPVHLFALAVAGLLVLVFTRGRLSSRHANNWNALRAGAAD